MQLIWDGLTGSLRLIVECDPLVLGAAWRSLWISSFAVCLASVAGIPIGAMLGLRRFVGSSALVGVFRVGMSLPTVLIGLLCYAMFSRRGPLGQFDMLYTQTAIVVGEFFLALPILVTWTHGAVRGLDRRVRETAFTLDAGPIRQALTCLSEARLGIGLAVMTAFARCITELGIAIMVGGNIAGRTRTLTTATALETARGEFERGVAMSLLLLLVAMSVTLLIAWLNRAGERDSDAYS